MEPTTQTEKQTKLPEFILTRMLDAPRELVYKAWSEAGRLEQWWGPKGFGLRTEKFDFRPGGIFHYAMLLPNGSAMYGRFIYRDMQAPGKIEFVNSFSDEAGGVTRAPFSPTWPLEMLNILTLTEQDGKTLLILRGTPLDATEEECRTYEAGFESMRQGFTGTLDQLEDYLAKEQA